MLDLFVVTININNMLFVYVILLVMASVDSVDNTFENIVNMSVILRCIKVVFDVYVSYILFARENGYRKTFNFYSNLNKTAIDKLTLHIEHRFLISNKIIRLLKQNVNVIIVFLKCTNRT